MAVGQMALPIDRRNGASVARPTPAPVEAVAGTREIEPVGVAVPVWVQRVTTASVVAVAGVAAVASYESPYVKGWVG
jgi:hypothetical protein